MSTNVLEPLASVATGAIDESALPCRTNDPELFFAETPARCGRSA
jgi:hypothetical protein